MAMTFRRGRRAVPGRLVVVDDYFPNLQTGFRVAEFNYYLEKMPTAVVLSTSDRFEQDWNAYQQAFPHLADRVRPFDPEMLRGAGLAYVNFLNNAAAHVDDFDRYGIPFAATLYPGGGFALGQEHTQSKLASVVASPWLRHLITTQSPITRTVLASLRRPIGVTEIFGGVLPEPHRGSMTRVRAAEAGLDIAFVAARYMEVGENKGYPTFVETALLLCEEDPTLRFHVVGGFDASTLELGRHVGRFTFHGSLPTHLLGRLLASFDIVVSPNIPFVLEPGNFDGFPTGSCVEASLAGAALVITDPLHLNQGRYEDGVDALIVDPIPHAIVERLRPYLHDRERVRELGRAGQQRSRLLFSEENQLVPRIALLEHHLRSRK